MIFYCVIRKKIYHQRICYIKFIIVFYANMILVLICTFFFISFIFLWCYMYTCISFKYVLDIYNIYLMTRIWFNFQSFYFGVKDWLYMYVVFIYEYCMQFHHMLQYCNKIYGNEIN